MTPLEKLEAAEKILDRSFVKIENNPLGNKSVSSKMETTEMKQSLKESIENNCTIFTDKNGKPLSPETKLCELVDGLTEDTKLIEIRLVKMKATKK